MLGVDAPEYLGLQEGDKKALKHLVKAAYILDEIYLKQDNEKNIAFFIRNLIFCRECLTRKCFLP
jgi:hypothetical protein